MPMAGVGAGMSLRSFKHNLFYDYMSQKKSCECASLQGTASTWLHLSSQLLTVGIHIIKTMLVNMSLPSRKKKKENYIFFSEI